MSSDSESEGGGLSPDERRALAGNQTMQLDAVSDELFEELEREAAEVPGAGAKPPPLPPKKRRWGLPAVVALVAVIVVAGVLGLFASELLFGEQAPEAGAAGTSAPAEGSGQEQATAEPEPDVVPLQLDPVIIETGEAEDEQ